MLSVHPFAVVAILAIDVIGLSTSSFPKQLTQSQDPIYFKGQSLLREYKPRLDVGAIHCNTLDDCNELKICTLYPILSMLAIVYDELLVEQGTVQYILDYTRLLLILPEGERGRETCCS